MGNIAVGNGEDKIGNGRAVVTGAQDIVVPGRNEQKVEVILLLR